MSAEGNERIIYPELHIFFRHAYYSHCMENKIMTLPEKLQEVQVKDSELCILPYKIQKYENYQGSMCQSVGGGKSR